MFENFTIFIPTMGRVEQQNTLTDLCLSPKLQEITRLVVRDFEFDDYDFNYGSRCPVVALPSNITDVGQTRQWIIENCETDYLIMLDDDLRFYKRLSESVSLRYVTQAQIEELFYKQLEWLEFDEFPITGISARQGNNNVDAPYSEITRQIFAHGVNKPLFQELGLRYDKLPLMEDFHLLLDLFTAGHKNRVSYTFCCGQASANAAGGCSTYRTAEKQKECAELLKAAHPDFVTVVEKQNQKSGWEGMKSRHDVRVQWKKAYASSQL